MKIFIRLKCKHRSIRIVELLLKNAMAALRVREKAGPSESERERKKWKITI